MEDVEIRCKHCDKLLGKGTALELTIKCPRCRAYNHVMTKSASPERQERQPDVGHDTE